MITHATRKRSFTKLAIFCSLFLLLAGTSKSQTITGDSYRVIPVPDTSEVFKPHGRLWGMAFGDYAYKGNADNLGRGGNNQYTNMPANTNLFQFRRLYLGYDYDISRKFTAVFLLAAENDYGAGALGQPAASVTVNTVTGTSTNVTLGNNGDLLMNNKFAPFVKLAYLRWKNIWKNSDLFIGQQNTPAYGIIGRDAQTPEEVWGYRSIERTISDIYGTPCYDMGASLQGWFDNRGNFGYDLMAGNGTMAKPETDMYKWIYGNVYAKFLDKRIVINLYQDYERLNWGVFTKGPNGAWYHDRNMTKLLLAYTTQKLTVGFEGFRNTLLGDVKVTGKDGNTYYRSTDAMATSFYVRGRILSTPRGGPRLGFFARFDNFDPSGNLSNIVDEPNTKSYVVSTAAYDPTTKQQFVLLGFDYAPVKNVHLMPNLWLNTYTSSLSPTATNDAFNPLVNGSKGTDAVWRLTFFWLYGK